MGHRARSALLTIAYLAFLTVLHTGAANAQSVSVTVDSTEAYAGFSIPVRVLLEIDSPIASIIVPLEYESSWLFPDSVSFHGSVVSPDHRYLATFSYDSNLVRVLVLPEIMSPMPIIFDPGGLLATVWFSVSPFAQEGFISIDTAYSFDSLCFDKRRFYYCPEELQASGLTGNQLYPDFTPGGVAIVRYRPER